MKTEGRELNFADMAKVVGELWQSIPTDEREHYEHRAAIRKAEYNVELAEYKKTDNAREYEKYLAEFKASYGTGSGSRDTQWDDECTVSPRSCPEMGTLVGPSCTDKTLAVTKKTRFTRDPQNESKDSNESRASLDSLKNGSHPEHPMSPHSVDSSSDRGYSFDFNHKGTSPSGRPFLPPVPASPSSQSTSSEWPASTFNKHDGHAPVAYAPHTSSGPPSATSLTGFSSSRQSLLGSPTAYDGAGNMSFRTLPPPVPTSRASAGGPSQLRHDPMSALLAAAESQAPMPSPRDFGAAKNGRQ